MVISSQCVWKSLTVSNVIHDGHHIEWVKLEVWYISTIIYIYILINFIVFDFSVSSVKVATFVFDTFGEVLEEKAFFFLYIIIFHTHCTLSILLIRATDGWTQCLSLSCAFWGGAVRCPNGSAQGPKYIPSRATGHTVFRLSYSLPPYTVYTLISPSPVPALPPTHSAGAVNQSLSFQWISVYLDKTRNRILG